MRRVLENGLAALQVDLNEVQVELFASKEQDTMQLYCLRYLNNTYRFYWRLIRLCYANRSFSKLSKLLTKIALGVLSAVAPQGCSSRVMMHTGAG